MWVRRTPRTRASLSGCVLAVYIHGVAKQPTTAGSDGDGDPTATPTSRWGMTLVLIGLCVFTVGGGVRVARQVQLASDIEHFDVVAGQVVLSELIERGGRDFVSARVVVRYEMDGTSHDLETSGNDGKADPAPDPGALLARYPLGVEVPVYVDPDDPDTASLTRDVSYTGDLGFFVGLLVVTLAFAAWLGIRRARSRAA